MESMVPCPQCRRHLRASERRCPFCGADVRPANLSANAAIANVGAVALTVLVGLGSSACSSSQSASDGHTTTTGGTTLDDSTGTGAGTGASTETDTGDGTNDTTAGSGSFYASGGDISSYTDCNPWLQDCDEGDKCVPYAVSGSSWDANGCVPILGDGKPGDPCVWDGLFEGTDSCDGTSICWNTQEVDGANVGVCTAFCDGSPDAPSCAEGTSCMIANEGVLNLCVELCDPLAQDCGEGLGCYWVIDMFTCVTTVGETAVGDLCASLNHCPPGSGCVDECITANCCIEFCSIIMPDCAGPTAECVPFFEEAPPGYEDIGLCIEPSCAPLGQDCPDGLTCYWKVGDFACESPGAAALGEPCDVASDCAEPSVCILSHNLPDCAGASCCTAFCSLAAPNCALPGTECVVMFDNDPPPGYEDVGVCIEP